jgi:hypothetical protein
MKKIASMNKNEVLHMLQKVARLQTSLISKLAEDQSASISPETFKGQVYMEALKAMPGMREDMFKKALEKNLTLNINPESKSVSWTWRFSKNPENYGRILNDACKSASLALGLTGDGKVNWG